MKVSDFNVGAVVARDTWRTCVAVVLAPNAIALVHRSTRALLQVTTPPGDRGGDGFEAVTDDVVPGEILEALSSVDWASLVVHMRKVAA